MSLVSYLHTQPAWLVYAIVVPGLTMTGVIMAAGPVMSLVLITEAPFSGESTIDPASLLRVVKAMETRLP